MASGKVTISAVPSIWTQGPRNASTNTHNVARGSPGSFSFREWDCTMALKGVKSLVPRGALLARHAPHEPNPFPQVNTHDNTASAAHRGVRRDSGLSPLSWETPSLARHSLLGLLCDVVWVSDL